MTEKQRKLIERLGGKIDPRVSGREASEIINRLIRGKLFCDRLLKTMM